MVRVLGVPVLAMVLVQIAYAVMNLMYKLAVEDGMNMRVLVAYRAFFAAAFMAPLALLIERFFPFFFIFVLAISIHVPILLFFRSKNLCLN